MKTLFLKLLLASSMSLLLVSCGSSPDTPVSSPAAAPAAGTAAEAAAVRMPDTFQQARIIADLLYEARVAHDDGRLMPPARANAFDRYMEVLALQADNPVARNGIAELTVTYRSLAESARRQGRDGLYQEYRIQLTRLEGFESEIPAVPDWSAYLPPPAPAPLSEARIIADILYAARLAYEDNRLMLPAGDNAYDRYMEVLGRDPSNVVARRGLEEIVDRYVVLAGAAMDIAQFDTAAANLNRAASINPQAPAIQAARQRLQELRREDRELFVLDPSALDRQGDDLQQQLSEIARYIMGGERTFLIVARTDAEGRWIYNVMRESVDGYRLRGNIALGSQPGIQIDPQPQS